MNKTRATEGFICIAVLVAVLFVGVWQIRSVHATTLFSDEFESGSFSAWTSNVSGSVVTSPVMQGTYAANLTAGASDQYVRYIFTDATEIWYRFYWRTDALPDADGQQFQMAVLKTYTGGSSMQYMYIAQDSGSVVWQLQYRNDSGWDTVTNSTDPPVVNTWTCIETHVKVAGSGGGIADLWINGVSEFHLTGLTNNDQSTTVTGIDIYGARTSGETLVPVFTFDSVVVQDSGYIGLLAGGGDTTPPTFGTITSNTTLAGNATQISCTINDDVGVSAWGFAWNNTGTWVNASKIAVSGSPITARYNGTWNSTVGNKVQVQFWSNDTSNNAAYSSVQTFTLTSSGSGRTEGDGVADSSWTYRISDNATACYLIDSAGTIVDSDSDSGVIINEALWGCANSGGSIYVYPDTYSTNTQIGAPVGNPVYNDQFSNIYLQLGAGTIIQRVSSTGDPLGENMFSLYNPMIYVGDGTVNFTLTSNGTAIFDAKGYACGAKIYTILNCTFSNISFQHLYGEGIECMRARYCVFENISVFSYDQSYADQGMFTGGCIEHCNFTNLDLNGNNQALSRGGFYLDQQNAKYGFSSSHFNYVTKLYAHNLRRSGIYLSGDIDVVTHNCTFTNCTVENIWSVDQSAIKLRPAINNTFTDIVIMDVTNALTTGTGYDPGPYGNCTGNYVQAAIDGCTVASLIFTTDGDSQDVSGNFFNLTVTDSKPTYFASGTDSTIKNNTVYLNFTDCYGAINLDSGNFYDNTFYLNFTNCGDGGHSDIYHWSGWTSMVNNTFNVYATSGNPNGLMDFVNGTQGNLVFYPYIGGGGVSVFIMSPTNTTYTSPTVSVELYASGGTIDTIWWNCKNGTTWIYGSNQTYTTPTSMTGFVNGTSYTFYGWANNTDGDWDEETVMFTVLIITLPYDYSYDYGSWW